MNRLPTGGQLSSEKRTTDDMRSDRNKKKNRNELVEQEQPKQHKGLVRLTRFWGFLFLLLSLAAAGILTFSGLLPSKYLLAAVILIGVLFLLLFPALVLPRIKKSRRVVALILSLLLGIGYGVGTWYLAGTLDFLTKITSIASSKETYYVVVRDDDAFSSLEDIAGKDVYATQSSNKYAQAEEKLKEQVDVNMLRIADLDETMNELLMGYIDVTFLNEESYDSLCEKYENLSDDTKILDEVTIRISLSEIAKPVSVASEPFNILITGMDTTGDISEYSRSDVNMIMTVNPGTRTVLLTSIPRDYYVPLPDVGEFDKLTHTGVYGPDETVAAVEGLLGIDMNYYIKVNYSTLIKLVDAIGGVYVDSDYEFLTYDGKYYFVEGENYLDGENALAFARERKAFPDGDFQRNRDQQKVLKAILEKMSSSSTLLLKYTSILNSIENNIEFNMPAADVKALVRMQLDDMSGWDIRTQSILGGIGDAPCYSLGNAYASVVTQDPESIAAAVAEIQAVMSPATGE